MTSTPDAIFSPNVTQRSAAANLAALAPRIAVLIPCYNEAEAIENVVLTSATHTDAERLCGVGDRLIGRIGRSGDHDLRYQPRLLNTPNDTLEHRLSFDVEKDLPRQPLGAHPGLNYRDNLQRTH